MRALVIAMLCATWLGGCDDTTPICRPPEKDPCDCPTGGPGERVCNDDGLGYGECVCTVDAGVDAPNGSEEGEPAAR